MRSKYLLFALAAVSALGWARAASADIIFTLGNHPTPTEENILFGTPESGSTITGFTASSNVQVNFTSLTGQTLYQSSQGQADIMSSSNQQQSALTSIDITAPGHGWGDFILNPLNGSGTATVTAIDNLNNVFSYALGNGSNFLTITTANNEFITEIQIMMSGGDFKEFKQPRMSDPCTLGPNGTCGRVPAPEPTTLALLGGGLLGLGVVRRRAK